MSSGSRAWRAGTLKIYMRTELYEVDNRIITSTRVKGLRVLLEHDENPGELDDEWMAPALRVEERGRSVVHAEYAAGEQWAPRLAASAFAATVLKLETPAAVREWLRTEHGIEHAEYRYCGWVIATSEWVAELGEGADVAAALKACADTFEDHAGGYVYGWKLQRETTWRSMHGQEMTTWTTVEDLWDLVGWEYAQQSARDALADAELKEPVKFPQQRPHVIALQSKRLWEAVIAPALLGETRADYFTVRTVLPPNGRVWGVDLRIGWGTETSVEQRLDESRTWAALVAIATGALPIDAHLALECRDLATADTIKPVTPLSKDAADVVIQVALLGEAPYPNRRQGRGKEGKDGL